MVFDPAKAKYQHKYYSLKNSNNPDMPPVEDYHKTLYELFDINPNSGFDQINIEDSGCSIKMMNRLRRAGFTTLDDLFSKNINEIIHARQIGTKTIPLVISFCEDCLNNHNFQKNRYISPNKQINKINVDTSLLYDYARSLIHGFEFDGQALSENERKNIKKAYDDLGKELFQDAIEGNESAKQSISYLTAVVSGINNLSRLNRITAKLSKMILQNPTLQNVAVKPLSEIYKVKKYEEFPKIFSATDLLADLPSIIQEDNAAADDLIVFSEEMERFVDWIVSGVIDALNRIRNEIVTNDKSERRELIIELQQKGNTLADIGNILGITRERVRQISQDAENAFLSGISKMDKDPVLFIQAMTGNQKLLNKTDLLSYLHDDKLANWLWACIQSQKMDCSLYEYIKENDTVHFVNVAGHLPNEINAIINSFPGFLDKKQAKKLIKDEAISRGISEETLWEYFLNKYYSYGKMYSTKRLKKRFAVDWVMKRNFPNGYKIDDENDRELLRSYIASNFGKEMADITPYGLDAQVSNVGILCDHGKYIHPSRVTIDKKILDKIDRYIAKNTKTAISYKELFAAFEKQLSKNQITNQYFLQGVMKYFGHQGSDKTPYYLFRDYITKDKDISRTDELDRFIQEKGIAHKSEILRKFSELNESAISQIQQRCPDVLSIGNGNYIHTSRFEIVDDDYTVIRAYLAPSTSESPVNIRIVYDKCKKAFPDFMKRNNLEDRDLLFAILSYMFKDEFEFSKPYISKKGEKKITNRSVILEILKPFDEIRANQLLKILENKGIAYNSMTNLMNLVYPDYIRTDQNKIMKKEITGLNGDLIDETLIALKKIVKKKGYWSSLVMPKRSLFPKINVKWTTFLLECLTINNAVVDYIYFPNQKSGLHTTTTLYVSKKYQKYDVQSLILNVLSKEYDNGHLKTKSDIRNWLISEGLITNELPDYLSSANFTITTKQEI